MAIVASASLLAAFQQLTDPRHRRGIRHPFPGLLAVIFLGLLSRQPDFASIARWAKRHWPVLKDAFGLTRRYAPHATTYGRVAAAFSVDEFRAALAGWLADGPVGDGKGTEPEVLEAHPDDLFARWPSLRVLTGDALFCQRPLARAIVDAGRTQVQTWLRLAGHEPVPAIYGPSGDVTWIDADPTYSLDAAKRVAP